MDFVKDIKDLLNNAITLDTYIASNEIEIRNFAIDIIRHGHCFMFTDKKDGTHFYPSRFMGYLNDTKEKYEESKREKKNLEKRPDTVDGRKTNSVITSILHCPLHKDFELEKKFFAYCELLGVSPDKRVHTFWKKELC